MSRLELKIPPAVVAILVVALMWLVRELLPALSLAFEWSSTAAAVLCGIGVALAAVGVVQFRRAGTTINPHSVANASAVVSRGVYAFTRNPMYLGIVICLAGVAIYLANVATIIGIPVFVAYMNRFQIEPEERALGELFGEAYSAYQGSVRRWI